MLEDIALFYLPFFTNMPEQALLHIVAYFSAACAFAAVIWGFKPATLMARKLQTRLSTNADLVREVKYSMLTVVVFGLTGVLGFTFYNTGISQLYLDVSDYGWLWLAASLPIKLVLHDAWFYWTHRAMHHRRLFRQVHWTHHKSKVPTPFTALSFDPPEAFSHALFGNLYMLLVPMHPIVGIAFFAIMIIRNVMGHTGYELHPRGWLNSPLTRWINTTTHHDLHHQNGNYNFGLYFTWWDKWMGTEHPDYAARFEEVTARSAKDVKIAKAYPLRAMALIGVTVLGISLAGSALARDLTREAQGHWVSVDETLIVAIEPCDDTYETYCGRIAYHRHGIREDGSPVLDIHNPDPTLQNRPLIGLNIGTNFTVDSARGVANGQIYSPQNGGTYRSEIRVSQTGDQLYLKGCWFIFCRTETLNRYEGQMPVVAQLN
ncbi:MAG: sterol desaturase family protein [Alphaproteobacteria bacterium]